MNKNYKSLVFVLLFLSFLGCGKDNYIKYFKSEDGKHVATLINHMNDPKTGQTKCYYICYGEYDDIPQDNYLKLDYHCDYSFDLRWSGDTLHIVDGMAQIIEDKRNSKMVYKSNQDSTEYDFENKKFIKPYQSFNYCD